MGYKNFMLRAIMAIAKVLYNKIYFMLEMRSLKEEFKKLKGLDEYVALVTVDAKNYAKTNLGIIKQLTKEQTPGVYVTLSKPYETIFETMQKKGIDTRLIIFIDAVTKTAGGELRKEENCLYIGSPERLSDISIAMDQAVTALPSAKRFLFFDSLSILLIYSQPKTVARFIHFLAGKMRVWKVKGIIISLRREKDDALIKELMQFCDVKLEF